MPPTATTSAPATYVHSLIQTTWTFVTFAVAVPLPLFTVQFCVGLPGCVETVTLYVLPPATAVANVNGPFRVSLSVSVLLFCSETPVLDEFGDKSYNVPPIVNVFPLLAHVAVTVMFADPNVPVELMPNVQISLFGCCVIVVV